MLTHPPATIAWDGTTLAMAVPASKYKGFSIVAGRHDHNYEHLSGGWNFTVDRVPGHERTLAMYFFCDEATGKKLHALNPFTDDHKELFQRFTMMQHWEVLPEEMFFYAAFVTASHFTTIAIRGGENSLSQFTSLDRNGPLRRDPRGCALGYSESMVALLLGQGFLAEDAVQLVVAESHGHHDPSYEIHTAYPFHPHRHTTHERMRSSEAYWNLHKKTQRKSYPTDAADPLVGVDAPT